MKSEKSVKILIDFIIQYEDTDYYDRCNEAMFTLIEIGKPSVKEIITALDNMLRKTQYSNYLDEALSRINDKEGRFFRLNILKDYIKNDKRYGGWFDLTLFASGFHKYDKEALPLLKQLLKLDITEEEEREIISAIEEIEDPEKYRKTLEKEAELLKPLFRQLMGTKKRDEISIFDKFKSIFNGNYKITDKERAEFLDRASEPDENFEANFICNSCNERQNIKTGLIWSIKKEKEDTYSFRNEIICKYCHSHDIKLTKSGIVEITKKQMRIFLGNDKGVMPLGKKIFVEDREIAYDKTYEYIKHRIKQEPKNGEIYLRAAKTAEKFNKYEEAIELYKKSLELNPKLIASYINLVEIYINRFYYYGIKESKKEATDYFLKFIELFNSENYNSATISNEEFIGYFFMKSAARLNITTKRKIGRNEPCHCGSGKKYKKCCLNKKLDSK